MAMVRVDAIIDTNLFDKILEEHKYPEFILMNTVIMNEEEWKKAEEEIKNEEEQ